MNIAVMILLLAGLVISAMLCMILKNLLKASIALAVLSAILSVVMFILNAHLAAAFELSVCAGLVTVVFISAISMTRIISKEETEAREKKRYRRVIPLPVLLIVLLAGALFILWPRLSGLLPFDPSQAAGASGEPDIFWNKRHVDLLGQVVIILAGVYGILIFFKEHDEK